MSVRHAKCDVCYIRAVDPDLPGGGTHSFAQDKLAKEEHNSALNLNKINTQWRMVLREVKTRALRKDIEILSQTFERVVDCKDSVIKVGALPKETLEYGCLDRFSE